MKSVIISFVFILIINYSCEFQWDINLMDKQTVYAPVNGNATFPWSYSLSPREHVQFIQYFLNSQLIAIEANGAFLPQGVYSSRVVKSGLAGLSLHTVSESDSGEMTITIDVMDSHGVVSIHNTSIILEVFRKTDDLLLSMENRLNRMESEYKTEIAHLKAREKTFVMFHSRYLKHVSPDYRVNVSSAEIFKCVQVDFNIGNGYDNNTGLFTAPFSGYYYFSASGGGFREQFWLGLYMAIDGVQATSYDSVYGQENSEEQLSSSLSCHLNKGQTVSVHSINSGPGYFIDNRFSFMGFLLSLD